MARDVQIAPGVGPAPQAYNVPNATEIIVKAVNATFDGTAAASSFVPTLEIVSDGGVVVARVPTDTTVLAGASAEVTFAPFLRGTTTSTPAGAITEITSADASVTITNPFGPITDLSVPASGGAGMVLICAQTLGAAATTFDTNTILGGNIPGIYKHLRVMCQYRTNYLGALNSGVAMRFNNDSGAHYFDQRWFAQANATNGVAQSTAAGQFFFGDAPSANATASWAGQTIADINNYSGTTFVKTFTGQDLFAASFATTDRRLDVLSGTWENTAAITRIQVFVTLGSFVAGSLFSLYGIS